MDFSDEASIEADQNQLDEIWYHQHESMIALHPDMNLQKITVPRLFAEILWAFSIWSVCFEHLSNDMFVTACLFRVQTDTICS